VNIAEAYYVGYLGTDALAGVALVFPVFMLMTMMSNGGLGSGVASAVARATGAEFEWRDHVEHALAAGLARDVIDRIANGQTDALAHPYSLVHAILTETTAWKEIPDGLQARAVAEWGREGLVEIVVVSGFYQMFAGINQGFAVGMADRSPD